MSLIKKSDVKNHLSAKYRAHMHLAPASEPDATGFSGTAPAAVAVKETGSSQALAGHPPPSGAPAAPFDASFAGPAFQTPAETEAARG